MVQYNKYLAGLNGRMTSSKKMIYQQANSLWFRKGTVKPKKSFLKKNKEYHNAQIYEAPFNAATVKDINTWVYAASITGSDWITAWKNSQARTLRIRLPQFSYDYSVSLRDPLYKMGIRDAFTSHANFTGISSTGSLQIDDVYHKTHIELNKNGTRAAAATAVVVKAGSALMEEPPAVYLDRPFL